MKKLILLLLLIVPLINCSKGDSDSTDEENNPNSNLIVDSCKVESVTDVDGNVYVGKYGLNNIDTEQKVFDNSIYRIWSMTKPIVAIAALKLVEEKKINLDDPITEYLPEFNDLHVMVREDGAVEDVERVNQYPTIKDLTKN